MTVVPEIEESQAPIDRGGRERVRAAFLAGLLALDLAALVLATLLPAQLPDTAAGTWGTDATQINDWLSAGQQFRVDREGLSRIDVALSTLKAGDGLDLQFYLREKGPEGPNLRIVRKGLRALPEGKILTLYERRWQDVPWVSFQFEPLYGYSGSQLYFNLEGKDIPRESTVQALVAYPNSYKRGEAYIEEKPAGCNLVFRTFTQGTSAAFLGTSLDLMSAGRPGLLGAVWVYGLLAVATLASMLLLFRRIARL